IAHIVRQSKGGGESRLAPRQPILTEYRNSAETLVTSAIRNPAYFLSPRPRGRAGDPEEPWPAAGRCQVAGGRGARPTPAAGRRRRWNAQMAISARRANGASQTSTTRAAAAIAPRPSTAVDQAFAKRVRGTAGPAAPGSARSSSMVENDDWSRRKSTWPWSRLMLDCTLWSWFNINRLQGQVDFLRDQSSFSTIELDLAEPGAAGPAVPRTRFAKAWSTAVDGLGAIAAAALVALVWLAPFALLALIAIWAFHRLRRPAAGVGLAPRPPAT